MRTIDISTRFIPATDRHGAKIRALDKSGKSVTISHPYELSGDDKSHRAIKQFLRERMPTSVLATPAAREQADPFNSGPYETRDPIRLAHVTPSGFAWKVDIYDECSWCAGTGRRHRHPDAEPEACVHCDATGLL